MTPTAEQGRLFTEPTGDDTVFINERCRVQTSDGFRVVSVCGLPIAHYAVGDRMAEAHAMVHLVEQGFALQTEVARAFGATDRTVRRYQERFESGGLPALGRPAGYPKGRRRTKRAHERKLAAWCSEGLSNRAIARRLGVTEKAVRKRRRRLGFTPEPAGQPALPFGDADPNLSGPEEPIAGQPGPKAENPAVAGSTDAASPEPAADPNLSASSPAVEEPPAASLDPDPSNRRVDRLMAYLGFLDDAAPRFRPGTRVPGAGVLLAVPGLIQSGILASADEVYGSIGPAFYGLRTTIVALVLMALLRVKRPEGLKERPPEDLGRILGLDRAPEVKTVRRKLTRLASFGHAAAFGRELARRRVATHGSALGFLYVDGHVRVYHGGRTIPKTHVARMRLSLPATTDYWVNDAEGEPLFVVTVEANAGMVKTLPELLVEVRALVGERRVTVVFDRGGWSPAMFQKLLGQGFDILTYRKGRFRRVPRRAFKEHTGVIDAREVAYTLADQGIRLLKGKLRLRQVTRLSKDGTHQTAVVTSRRDLPALEVAYRMFERWKQENFFKYLREEYALDALVDYQVEPDDPERDVPNPERQKLDAELHAARAAVARLSAQYGLEAIANVERLRPTMRGFKIANAKKTREVYAALKRVVDLQERRARTPARIPVQEVVGHEEVVKLAVERKHLTNLVKMVAYQAESELVRILAPYYRRAEDEGRTLIQNALASAADIEVTENELHIRIAPLSSPHRTRAIAAVCEELNLAKARFPGTRLTLRYAVADRPDP